jgi:predicted O-methyltransferase YrrM
VHSPFVYDLTQQVILHGLTTGSGAIDRIEELRLSLTRDERSIELHDLGAGSHIAPTAARRLVAELAAHGARRAASGALLHRLVAWLRPPHALELGTQLGISALYQASALGEGASLTTVEGAPPVAALAQGNWATFGKRYPIVPVTSAFDDFLRQPSQPWDYVLLDGHHDEAATLRYVGLLLPLLTEGACIVFDDIRWSRGMHRAWQRVCAYPEVSVSIDLFRMGLAFVRRPQAHEHFRLWPGLRIFAGQ